MPRKPLTPEQQKCVAERMPDYLVHPAYDRATVSFERIAWGTGILCIECKACGKRNVLTKEDCPQIRDGNKAEVRHATFKCSRHNCGSSEVRIYAGCPPEEAEMFAAGDPVPPSREIPAKASWEK
jgi:hypothetical protein